MNQLFRPETMPPTLAEMGVPLGITPGWAKLYTILVLCVLVVGGAVVAQGSYARKVKVSGFLVPDKGLIKIQAPRSGRVSSQMVEEGQHVRKGQPLFVIDVSDTTALGRTGELIDKNLRERRILLDEELRHLVVAQAAETNRLDANLASLRQQIVDLDIRIGSSRDYLRLAQSALTRTQVLETQSVASHATRDKAEQDAISAGLQLAALQAELNGVRGQLAQADAESRGLPDQQARERSQLRRTQAEVDQQLLQIEEQKSLVICASEAGTVTQLTAHVGSTVDPSNTPVIPMLTIVPDGATLVANLYVPSSAIGFVAPGVRTLLRYEAFPYEKFGLQEAVIATLSRTAVNGRELPFPISADEPFYLVTATLAKSTVTAFGKEEPLQPGMKLLAGMVLEHRKLWEWAIEPVLAARGSL